MFMFLCYSLNDLCFGISFLIKCDKVYFYCYCLKLMLRIEDFEVKLRNKDYKSGWKKINLIYYKIN